MYVLHKIWYQNLDHSAPLSCTLTNQNTKANIYIYNTSTFAIKQRKEQTHTHTLQTQLRARDFRPSWHPKDKSDRRGKLLGVSTFQNPLRHPYSLPWTYTSQCTMGKTELKPNYLSTVAGFSLSTVHWYGFKVKLRDSFKMFRTCLYTLLLLPY